MTPAGPAKADPRATLAPRASSEPVADPPTAHRAGGGCVPGCGAAASARARGVGLDSVVLLDSRVGRGGRRRLAPLHRRADRGSGSAQGLEALPTACGLRMPAPGGRRCAAPRPATQHGSPVRGLGGRLFVHTVGRASCSAPRLTWRQLHPLVTVAPESVPSKHRPRDELPLLTDGSRGLPADAPGD